MTSATAPGKVILLGEHAVVYGQPALAIPVMEVGATITIEEIKIINWIDKDWKDIIQISAPGVGRFGFLSEYGPDADPIACVIENVLKILEVAELPPIHIQIQSTIPVAAGLGSGAAVSVALAKAMAAKLGKSLPDEEISQIAFEAEILHHGTPSGIDNTVITYAQPVYFVKGKPVETFQVKDPFWLIIADSGISAETRETVGDVRKLWKEDAPKYEKVFLQIGQIVKDGRSAIQKAKTNNLGSLMNQNHSLLKELTVSSDRLDMLVEVALVNGASGAKLSGGGRGGNIIALAPKEKIKQIEQALLESGAQSVITTLVS